METIPTRAPFTAQIIANALITLALALPVSASEPTENAASFLSFETRTDGRCHNLSEGGKLMVMRNNHPSRKIDFRLIRYFIDVPQRGRATGTAEPGGEPVLLGCTLVGGRPQRWDVERANFSKE